MRAGKRDKRIIIERKVTTEKDDFGHTTPPAWEQVCEVWAEVLEVVAKERIASPQPMAVRAATMKILYRTDITTAMRVRYDGTVWNIKGRAELGRREELQLLAEAVEAKPV